MNTSKAESASDVVYRVVNAELSPGPRIAHGALLFAALTGTVVVTALWITEPDLPLHTRVAFVVLSMMGAAWAGYAIWVLTHRRVLFAQQRFLAGWLAVAFTSIFTAGAFAIGIFASHASGLAAGAMGIVLLAVAAWFLMRARQRLNALRERRRELEALQAGAA